MRGHTHTNTIRAGHGTFLLVERTRLRESDTLVILEADPDAALLVGHSLRLSLLSTVKVEIGDGEEEDFSFKKSMEDDDLTKEIGGKKKGVPQVLE